jgi:lipid A 4'-phosphatase
MHRRHPWKLLFALCALIFLAFPQIDLLASRLFYEPGAGFFLRHTEVPEAVYRFIRDLGRILPWVLLAPTVASFLVPPLFRYRRPFAYLLLVLVLGPGLIVNGVFKDNLGRARPDKVTEFGGTSVFTPAFIPSRECASNCAFVSGHAALGAYPLSLAFLFPRRRRWWLCAGAASGGIIGLMRVIQGKHYLSDVVFAFFIVYATAAITYDLLYRRYQNSRPN